MTPSMGELQEAIVSVLTAHPWLMPLMGVSLAIWVTAVVTIVRSRKFLRKLLWLLLSIVSFSFHWTDGPITISAGFPVGAVYVLGFWLFGPHPTPEQIAAARKRAEQPPTSRRKALALRAAYGVAILATLLMGWTALSGSIFGIFERAGFPAEMLEAMRPMMIAPLVLLFAVLIFLSFRPYFWGKIIAFWAGLSWLGFSGATTLMAGWSNTLTMILAAGLIMLAVGITHQVIDPRWSGPPLSPAPDLSGATSPPQGER